MSASHTLRRSISSVVATLVAGVAVALVIVAGSMALDAPVVAASGAQGVETTTTLPTDNRQLGDSITRPNSGADPVDAGDPGGWLQVSLFYLVCLAIVVIVGLVWWSSRRARRRRDAAGFDPVALARARGEGLRRVPSEAASGTTPAEGTTPRSDPAGVDGPSDAPQHAE